MLITQDFAMKFLPTQYRETQADFFGKRGISWHLTVCQSKQRGELVAQTSVHCSDCDGACTDDLEAGTLRVNQSCLPPRERRVPSLHKYHSSQQNIA